MKGLFLAALVGLLSTPAVADTVRAWAFQPGRDVFSGNALLDLSDLNEDVAGARGFVTRSADGAAFLRGDGTPIRFWAVNTTVATEGLPALRDHARFLAKRGVNMVRLHGQLPQTGPEGGPITAINGSLRAQLWRLVTAMKDEGIYVTFSPYYPHAVGAETARRWRVPQDSPGLAGLIYFDPVVQAAYKGWLRETLVPVNPHTGLALKDDPALAILQMQNEDSLLFWSLNELRGREARLLAERFGAFATLKYGSLAAARQAWGGRAAPGPIGEIEDDWDTGRLALSNIWHLTDAAGRGWAESRLRDQAEFLTTLMRDWHAEVARFLRDDIGARQLFNAGNWRTADPAVMDDLERYAYTSGDIIGVNRYVNSLHDGPYRGWAITQGDRFQEDGILHRPLDLPVTLRQPAGHPYIIPETLWVPPVWQQSEGPLLMAAYQALTGIDISYWFSVGESQWRHPQSANGYLPSVGKWVANTPQVMGAFPAAALIFRLGLIEEARPVVIDHRTRDDLWARNPPLAVPRQGRDPNRDSVLDRLGTAFGVTAETADRANPYSWGLLPEGAKSYAKPIERAFRDL